MQIFRGAAVPFSPADPTSFTGRARTRRLASDDGAVPVQDLGGRPGPFTPEVINRAGNVQSTGTALYTTFLLPVEVTSVLLLVAAVGAVYLAMRKPR